MATVARNHRGPVDPHHRGHRGHGRRRWLHCPALVALLLITAVCAWAQPGRAFKRTEVGEAVKDFHLSTPSGASWQLRAHLGEKATVVVFWALWNPRSTPFLADLQEWYAQYAEHGLEIVAINAENGEWDPATADRIIRYVGEGNLNYPVVVDQTLDVYDAYGVKVLPSAVLADGTGTVVELLQGYPSAARVDFRHSVERALGLREDEPESAERIAAPPPAPPKIRRMVEMGKLLVRKRLPRKAIPVLEKAVAEAPDYGEAYQALAAALTAAGREAEAAAVRARWEALRAAPPPAPATDAAATPRP